MESSLVWSNQSLGKPAVPVVSKSVVCVAHEMMQLVIMCPAVSMATNQGLLVCRKSCILCFPLIVAERWCRTNRHWEGSSIFIGIALRGFILDIFSRSHAGNICIVSAKYTSLSWCHKQTAFSSAALLTGNWSVSSTWEPFCSMSMFLHVHTDPLTKTGNFEEML